MMSDPLMQRVIALGVTLGALFDELRATRHAVGMERVAAEYRELVAYVLEHSADQK